jgi:hypothetical protein
MVTVKTFTETSSKNKLKIDQFSMQVMHIIKMSIIQDLQK